MSSASARSLKIKADNVKQLGLAWYADLDTNRGQEATPLVIDGVLYVSTAWSMVKAYDAKPGHAALVLRSRVPRELGVRGCCDVVSRGVAAWKGKIFVGNLRRPAGRARRAYRQASLERHDRRSGQALHDHAGAARRQRARDHRQQRSASTASAVTSRLTTPRPASWPGVSTPCRATLPSRSSSRFSPKPPRPGMASGGSLAAAARCGKRSPTTLSLT